MDFFTLLRQDHERAASIFKEIQRGFDQPDSSERHRLFQQLKKELDLHAEVEDLQVYRVFQQAETTRDDARDAMEAHRQIKILLDELEAAQTFDYRWVTKFQQLQKVVEAHVAMEENEMFRKTEAIMTPQEAEELGTAVQSAKEAIRHNAPPTEGGTPEAM
jgi:hypothetical protein